MGDGLGALEAEGSALPAGFSWSSPWSPQVLSLAEDDSHDEDYFLVSITYDYSTITARARSFQVLEWGALEGG
jgi:hypothetical protein